jgi:hypothetical protein
LLSPSQGNIGPSGGAAAGRSSYGNPCRLIVFLLEAGQVVPGRREEERLFEPLFDLRAVLGVQARELPEQLNRPVVVGNRRIGLVVVITVS